MRLGSLGMLVGQKARTSDQRWQDTTDRGCVKAKTTTPPKGRVGYLIVSSRHAVNRAGDRMEWAWRCLIVT